MSLSSTIPISNTSNRLSFGERFNIRRFTHGEKASAGPIVLSHRRIFILPTRVGMFCGATLAVMLLASIIYNNNPGFILTFLLGSVCLVSILHNFRTLSGLCVSVGRGAPVFAGETARYLIRIENHSSSDRFNIEASFKGQSPDSTSVAAGSASMLEIPAGTKRRGWFNPGAVTLSSRYPLGLFRAWSPLNFSMPILVYPMPAERSIMLPSILAGQGGAQSRHQDCEDYSGLLEYQPGDSLRKIHWKAYAKGQGLMVKQFSGERVADLWLDLDQTPGSDLESRISQLCRCILDAERAGLLYGLKLPGYTKDPGHGEQHQNTCLKALALH